MGLMDVFKATDNRSLTEEVERLTRENQTLREQLTPSLISSINDNINSLKREKDTLQEDVDRLKRERQTAENELIRINEQLNSTVDIFECGVYSPKYDFESSAIYAERLSEIKEKQKKMIADGRAASCGTSWTVLGSREKGIKMEKDTIKLLLRAFNNECDGYIRKVTYSNIETTEKHIQTSYDVITKLAKVNDITISTQYLALKKEELYLAYEYACKKQDEKEAEKEERARLREEARLQKEIEEERKKIEKEQAHYQNALAKLNVQLAQNPTDPELLAKQKELQEKIKDAEKAMQEVDYREANKRAGYVYVISNVGAFGENVYKIGMTRRLDPQERVDELGDASVPFNFDVHAMIFTDDAPKLEAALHKAFEDKKVNMVNPRREFFHVSLDEIKAVIRRNYDKTVEFSDYPEAEQWRVSARMRGERTATAPSFPRAEETSRAVPQEKTLAEIAVEAISRKRPAAVCRYDHKNGVHTISIKDGSKAVGTMRVSKYRTTKCDYVDSSDNKIHFFRNIDDIAKYI